MGFEKSQPIESVPTFFPPDGNPMGPLKKMDGSPPRTKSACPRNKRERWQHFEHLQKISRAGRYEEGFSTKPKWGRIAPVCSVELSGCELEFELIHTQMAQKPVLWAEVYARSLRASQNFCEVPWLLPVVIRRLRVAVPNMIATSGIQRS
jgi:hypothetical protein